MAYPENTINDTGLKKVWDMIIAKLNLKVDKEAGKGLSTNDFTTTEKNKLSSIESGAEVNTVTSVAGKTGDVTLTKSDVGLGNVGNFKAVSTSANQGLTDTEKSNARANINAPSNGDIQSSKTIKSSVITVPDAAPINAEDITVDITPQQDLHGYGKPWAGGAGKNKLPLVLADIKALNTIGTWSGNTYTLNNTAFEVNEDDNGYVTEIKANGTPTNNILYFRVAQNISVASPLIFSTGYTDTWEVNGHVMEMAIDNTSYKPYDVSGVEIPTGTYELHIAVAAGRAINNNYKPMLRSTTVSDYSYAPYTNICPIEGRTGAELDRVGINQWDEEYIQGNFTFQGEFVSGSYMCSKNFIPVKPNTAYTIRTYKDVTVNYYAYEYDINQDFVYYGGGRPNGSSFTTKVNTHYIKIEMGGNYGYPYTNDIVVCEGSTPPTAYEPYQGQKYTASFGETVHGGKWHVTKGGTDKTYGYVEFDGSDDENWIMSTSQQYLGNAYILLANCKNNANFLCNEAEPVQLSNFAFGKACIASTTLNVWFFNTSTTLSDFRAYLAQHPLQICYELATPTTISTPKQNVPMLQGINTVSADCGDTQLKYQPDNVIGELKGEIEDNIIYEDFKWTTDSSKSYSAGTPGTYGTSSWRDVKKEGYDVIGVTFVENRRFGDCILTLYYIPSTSHVEVIIFRATSSAVTIADEDIEYRVAYKKRT